MQNKTLLALILAGFLGGCSDDDAQGPTADAATAADGQGSDGTADLPAGDSTGTDGGISVTTCLADVARTRQHGFVNVLEFEDAGQTLQVGIAREPGDRSAVGETFPYDLKRFALVNDGASHCISDAAALSYEFGHHNWNDIAEAVIGTTRYKLNTVYDVVGVTPTWKATLEALDASSGNNLWGPVELSKTSCRSVPPEDVNGCLMW